MPYIYEAHVKERRGLSEWDSFVLSFLGTSVDSGKRAVAFNKANTYCLIC